MFTAPEILAQSGFSTWVKKNGPIGGEIYDIEVDAATGKVFLLDGDRKPYVSTDNGATWQAMTFVGSDSYFYDIEITNGTIFMVAGYDLFASTDGGVTFPRRMGSTNPYSDVRVLRRAPDSGYLFALSYYGLYMSTDNGVNWSLKNNSLGDIYTDYLAINSVDQIFVLKENPSTFYFRPFRSIDGGAIFTEASTNIPSTENTHGLFVKNDGTNIYAVTNTNIYSSTDGTNWVSIKTGSITGAYLSDYGDLQKGKIEFSADGLGMYFLDNNNQQLHSKGISETNWQLRASDFPGPGLAVTCASALNYSDPATSTVYFGTPAGAVKTTTGGASFAQINTGISAVDVDGIFADYFGNLYLKTPRVGWMKSTDGGDTWTRITNTDGEIRYFFSTPDNFASNLSYGNALFVITDQNKLYRSYNEAVSWNDVSRPGGFVWATGLGGSKILALQTTYSPAAFYYSQDNGGTWTFSALTISGLPSDYSLDEDRIVVASENRIFVPVRD
jgi:photosystem II stability/assembly factor-like uncharacterized protein